MAGLTVCACTGCPHCGDRCVDLTTTSKCDGCRAATRRRSDARRPSARQRGYDSRWERTRCAYLAEHPTCEADGCPARATEVDHIDGLGPHGPRGHHASNLRAHCKPHHSQRTARDQPGGWNAR